MVTKICRVCGKEYPACRDARRNPSGTFRWQEVACSEECGSIYFNLVMSGRSATSEDKEIEKPVPEDIAPDEAEWVDDTSEDDEYLDEDDIEPDEPEDEDNE